MKNLAPNNDVEKMENFDINKSIQYLINDLQSGIKKMETLKNKQNSKEKIQSFRDVVFSLVYNIKFKIQILDELPQDLKRKNIDFDISKTQINLTIDNTDKKNQKYIQYVDKYFDSADRLVEYIQRGQKICKKLLGNATISLRERTRFEYKALLHIYFDDENKIVQISPNYNTYRLCEKMFKDLDFGDFKRLFVGEIITPHLKKIY